MSSDKFNGYFIIQSWMTDETRLNLKTVERDVFAIVYGFSQDGTSDFHGSLSYMSALTGYSRNSICVALKNLTEKNLLIKEEQFKNGIKYCSYTANMEAVQGTCTPVQGTCTPVQGTCTPVQGTCTNNIDNKKDNKVLSKDKNNSKNGNESFLGSVKKEPKQNLYSQCISLIDNFIKTNNCFDIRELLIHHLDLIVEEKKLRGQKQYQGILNKLQQAHEKGSQYNDIINYSIEHGYPTFYEQNSKQGTKKFIESGNQHVESFTEEDEKNLHEFQRKLKKEGKQIYF